MANSPDETVVEGPKPTAAGPSSVDRRKIGPIIPPTKSQEELQQQSASSSSQKKDQRAYTTLEQQKDAEASQPKMPPIVRSILDLSHVIGVGYSLKLRACCGFAGGVFYGGKPYCFSSGFRDGSKRRDMDDKNNHLRLKDPFGFGILSTPISVMMLCQLHEEGLLDLEKPLIEYLPELGEKFDRLTGRSILSFQTVLDSSSILKDCRVSYASALLQPNVCAAMQQRVYRPISMFFSAVSPVASLSSSSASAAAAAAPSFADGATQRRNMVSYLRSCRMTKPRARLPQHGRFCHFSIALLIAAAERQLQGKSFEQAMRERIFVPTQAHPAGFGPPALYRDPNDIFFRPTGQTCLHQRYRHPLPIGASENCGPALFNASLNLHAPVEDFAKLLSLSMDTIKRARGVLGAEDVQFPHYEFGVFVTPARGQFALKSSLLRGLDFVPSPASFKYSVEHDTGTFSVASCGSRTGRSFTNFFTAALKQIYFQYIVDRGIDPDATGNEEDDGASSKSSAKTAAKTEERLSKFTEQSHYSNYFTRHNAHRRL